MNLRKRFMANVMVAALTTTMALSLSACSNGSQEATTSAQATTEVTTEAEAKNVETTTEATTEATESPSASAFTTVDKTEYPEFITRAIVNESNCYRIQEFLKRAEAGEELTIGFIGGSITQGSGASKYDNCYAHRVFNWFVETFPQSTFKEVNAGIGATTSELGAARIQEDLLSYKPDFVVLEFSVNDSDSFFYARTYEGCVRQILTAENAPALITLNMVQYNDGVNAQIKHSAVSKNYSVPEVSMKNSVYVEITKGNIEASDVSKDMLHPNDLGHEYTAKCITYYLSKILDGTYSSEADTEIPSVIYEGNAFLSSVRLNNKSLTNGVAKGAGLSNFAVELNGFEEDTAVQNGVSDCFKNGWSAKEEGASITLTGLKGSRIALLYQRKPSMKSANAIAILDGDEANAVSLDGNFENGWGNWLYLDDNGAFEDLDPSVEHTVEIRIVEAGEQDFYLASVLVSGIEK